MPSPAFESSSKRAPLHERLQPLCASAFRRYTAPQWRWHSSLNRPSADDAYRAVPSRDGRFVCPFEADLHTVCFHTPKLSLSSLPLPRAAELPLSAGELNFLNLSMQGSVMQPQTRWALRGSWGLRARHVGNWPVEAGLPDSYMHGLNRINFGRRPSCWQRWSNETHDAIEGADAARTEITDERSGEPGRGPP